MSAALVLTLKRLKDQDTIATTGDLWTPDDKDHWFTLEPPKPIPSGLYQLKITPSPKFKRPLPLLIDVPGHDGIRIHPGNTAADTEGCILLGDNLVGDYVGPSDTSFDRFFDWLSAALAQEDVYLDIGWSE